jgi:hypothetical protein
MVLVKVNGTERERLRAVRGSANRQCGDNQQGGPHS